MFAQSMCIEFGIKASSESSVKHQGGGSLAIVEDARWPVDMCGFEDMVFAVSTVSSQPYRTPQNALWIAGATASRGKCGGPFQEAATSRPGQQSR